MKKRAVGYCKISTLMQVDNTSLKDQEDKFMNEIGIKGIKNVQFCPVNDQFCPIY